MTADAQCTIKAYFNAGQGACFLVDYGAPADVDCGDYQRAEPEGGGFKENGCVKAEMSVLVCGGMEEEGCDVETAAS